MPHALIGLLAVTALVVMLVVAFVDPRGWVEALVGVALCGRGGVQLGRRHPVPGRAPLLGPDARAHLRRGSGHDAALSLDATVVLLTPVVVATAAGAMASPRPMVYACVRLANSASLLLPVSNLTNLLAMPSLGITLVPFALTMAPVWLVLVAVEYVGHRLFFHADLSTGKAPGTASAGTASAGTETGDASDTEPGTPHLPRFPLLVVLAMLIGSAVTSPLGVAPAWPAAAAAIVLSSHAVRRGVVTPRVAARALRPTFAAYVLCLGVVVVAVAESFLGDLVAAVLLAYTGSLANLLWRRTLVRRGLPPSTVTFHRLSALVIVPTAVSAVVVLWLWAPLVG